MIQYTDYDFYINTYKGNMPESDFNKLVISASYEVQKNIFNRSIEGFENEIALATCSVADVLLKIEQLENKKSDVTSNKILKSESIKDYSRTFDSLSINDITSEISNQKTKIMEELRKYLLNTGLLYRGV